MVDSGDKDRDYLNLLDDDEDSDNEDANWKRQASSSNSGGRTRISFNDSSDSISDRKVLIAKRNQNFNRESSKETTTRTVTRTVKTDKPLPSPVTSNPPTPRKTSPSGSVWKRLAFRESKASDTPSRSPPSSTSQRSVTTIKPPTPPSNTKHNPSSPYGNRKPISPPSTIDSCDVRTRLPELVKDKPIKQRPPIPDTLDYKPPPPPLFTPPKQKYTDRDTDLRSFVKRIKAEMLFHQSLDRIYMRSLRELPAMKAIAELPNIIHYVIEGVLFDPEIELDDDTVHKIIKLLTLFDLDNTKTWTFLIDKVYNLVTKSTETHYVRMNRFVKMSFHHLYDKKVRLLPETARFLLKLAQVHPFITNGKPPNSI